MNLPLPFRPGWIYRGPARGFSLVELLIALAIGLLALMFAMRIVVSSERNKATSAGGSDAMQNGVVPPTDGNDTVCGFPDESTTCVWRAKSDEKRNHEASSNTPLPASLRPPGLNQMAPGSSAPATKAPPRASGRTPRSEK